MRALALIDGEHYAPTVRDALAELPYDFAGAVMVGGTEKLREGAEYGVPVYDDLDEALRELEPAVVVDLSDEPVLGPARRFRVASQVLAAGVGYVGADFRFEPPPFEPFSVPSIAVYADGKRVGKTAVSGHVTRTLAADRDVLVLAMGRGGPQEPELVEERPTLDDLLALSRGGSHAASDYLELAIVTGVPAIGCRRCAGGLAGAVASSNVAAGLELARERSPDLVVLDGSGAAIPPVASAKRILVTSTYNDPADVTGYLNAYRILLADLAVITMCGEDTEHERLAEAIRQVKPELPVISAELRPRPLEPVIGRRVAYFTTARKATHERLAYGLRADHGAHVTAVCGSLSDRAALERELASVEADVFLTEVKAAGIDIVAEAGRERGVDVVLAANDVVPLPGQPDLDAELRALAAGEPVGT